MAKNSNPEHRLTQARSRMILDHPFWGVLATHLPFVVDESVETLAVDGINVYYNPKYVETLASTYLCAAVAHEAGHCVFEHFIRENGRNSERWNVACDYALNAILVESGFQLHPSWLFERRYHGMTAEAIYALLPEDLSGLNKRPQDVIRRNPQAATTERKLGWKAAVAQAVAVAKSRGKLPGGLGELVDDLLNPKVPWEQELRAFFTSVSDADYSWARPNKNFLAHQIIIPSLYSEGAGTYVLVRDTSMSVGKQELTAFNSEIAGIFELLAPEKVYVLDVDTKIQKISEYSPGDSLDTECHGRGGTDFCPPFAWVQEQGIVPEALIYLTDLEGPFPEPPPYPTLWVTTGATNAPFGKVIELSV